MVYANIFGNWIKLTNDYLIDGKNPYDFATNCYQFQDKKDSEYFNRKIVKIENRNNGDIIFIPIIDIQYKQ